MADELLLGVDIGTSATKAVLCTPDGRIVARAAREHGVSLPRPGWVEQDPDAVWWAGVVAVCRELLDGGAEVAAAAVSGIGPCVAPCDTDFRPLRPAILYGVDTRAVDEIPAIEERLGRDAIAARCGSPLTSQAGGPKLAWLARHEPDTWARAERVTSASSFAAGRLTGEYVLDHHTASQYDPLYDLARHTWIDEWAADLAPGLPLPRLAWPAEVIGTVTERAAAETGLRAGTPVAAGTVDAWAEALSGGVRDPGDLMLMYGSTMFLVAYAEAPRFDSRLWCTTGVLDGTHCLAGGMATSGSLTGWLRELTGSPPYETLLAEAEALPAGAEGLVLLPYFLGERTPLFDARARGVICGLTLRHGRGHLYRAALEATAYAVRHHLEIFAELDATPRRTVAVGGGARGGLWPQIVSDVTGVAQELPAETIGAAYGSALLAAIGAGLAPAGASWARADHVVAPRAERAAAYDDLYRVYRELYPATRPLAHALADLQSAGDTEGGGDGVHPA